MKNGIAKLLKVIAILLLIAGIICTIWGLFTLWQVYNVAPGVAVYKSDVEHCYSIIVAGVGGIFSALFIRGFAEKIKLLQEIKDNTKEKE